MTIAIEFLTILYFLGLMMNMNPKIEAFKVTCLECGGESRIRIIDGQKVMYIDHTPIIACRLRGDMRWGFECMCGNDSRLAREEKKDIDILVQGGAHAIKHLADSLKINDEDKFIMEAA